MGAFFQQLLAKSNFDVFEFYFARRLKTKNLSGKRHERNEKINTQLPLVFVRTFRVVRG
jgi:hypothetical protein